MSGDLPHEAHLAALAALDGVGPARLRWLLGLGEPAEVWERVTAGRLPRAPGGLGIGDDVRRSWAVVPSARGPEQLWRRCVELDVGVLSLGSPGYPPALAGDIDPPVVLFCAGDPDRLAQHRVAIIGTRRATGYGLRVAEEFGRTIAEEGASVVSGLALGIDAAGHRGVVAAVSGAAPVAVVGGGLDVPCPARNRGLYREVRDRGAVFSEVPPGVPASPWRFPVRNRVIAALAQTVVVVESPGAGGSMHTVREALSRDRTVLAVPGPIDSATSEGANRLIAEGALCCAGVDDLLVAAGLDPPSRRRSARDEPAPDPRAAPTGDAAAVLDSLGWRPVAAERVGATCGLGFAELAAALVELELQGWIRRTGSWVERVARPATVRGRGRGAV